MDTKTFSRSLSVLFFVLGFIKLVRAEEAPLIKKLLIGDSEASTVAIPAASGGEVRLVVQNVPLCEGPEFATLLQPYFGKPLTFPTADALAGEIKQYAIKHDRVVNVLLPTQQAEDVAAGILRLGVVVSRYHELDFKGNRWFSSQLLKDKLGIHPGDEISIARLDEAVNWANTNPFRRLQVLLMPVDQKTGTTNLIVGVQERLPVRLMVSYDDTGSEVIGKRHYTGSLHYGNFLGRDHQLSYQITTTDHQSVYRAQSLTYEVPLPWRHKLTFSASYLELNPTLYGVIAQTGRNAGADLRYTWPMSGKDLPTEFFAGLNYKQNNNNLAYGGTNFGGLTDIFQVVGGFSSLRRDSRGAWVLGATVTLSPGHFNSRNTSDAFQGYPSRKAFPIGRQGSNARYLYGNVSLQRLVTLPREWQLVSRATLQASSANLLGSEQLSIGGSSTVRGFDERIMTGDEGFVFSNDVQTPGMRMQLPFLPKTQPPLETHFTVFYDAGQVRSAHVNLNDAKQYPLASSGVGLRASLGVNFYLTADYGWQITRLPARYSMARNRGHVKVVLAY